MNEDEMHRFAEEASQRHAERVSRWKDDPQVKDLLHELPQSKVDEDVDTYFVVHLKAYAFETEDQARIVADKLLDAFCDLPETEGYGASAHVRQESEDDELNRICDERSGGPFKRVTLDFLDWLDNLPKEPTPELRQMYAEYQRAVAEGRLNVVMGKSYE